MKHFLHKNEQKNKDEKILQKLMNITKTTTTSFNEDKENTN